MDKHLSWSPHVSKIKRKTSRTLNFLKRNLNNCSTQLKAAPYLAVVRPQLEYASIVWDPIYNNDVHQLKNIQRRAARWVLKDYGKYSSVTSISNISPGLNFKLDVRYPDCRHFTKHFTTKFPYLFQLIIFQ